MSKPDVVNLNRNAAIGNVSEHAVAEAKTRHLLRIRTEMGETLDPDTLRVAQDNVITRGAVLKAACTRADWILKPRDISKILRDAERQGEKLAWADYARMNNSDEPTTQR